ncbi:MAG: DciA family protein [Pyrinomonadaceae bacterium]
MEALIRALPALLSVAGDNEEVAEAAARIAWRRAAGEPLCQHAAPFRLYHTTLIVAVSDAIWQKQMVALSGQLLSRLNSMLGQKAITFIEFRIDPKTVAAERSQRRPVAGGESADSVLSSVPDELVLAASSIQDESLRRRFLLAAGANIRRGRRERDEQAQSEI